MKLKVFIILLLLNSSYQFKKYSPINETKLLVSVLSESIHEIFIRLEIKFDFIIYENVSLDTLKVVNDIHKKIEIPIQIRRFPYVEWASRRLPNSALVFLDSFQRYKEFYYHHGLDLNPRIHPKKIRYLIYVTQPFKVDKIGVNPLDSVGGAIAHYSYFVVNYKGESKHNEFFKSLILCLCLLFCKV